MDNFRKWFTIKQLVTGGPIILLIVLSLMLGVSRYYSEYEKALNHALELAKTGAQPILALMKASVGGGNYANVRDESALDLYQANRELLFFSVEGKTDSNHEPYGIAYLRDQERVARTYFPADYQDRLETKVDKIKKALDRLPADHRKRPKIEKMLQEKQRELNTYQQAKSLLASAAEQYVRPDAGQITDGYYLDKNHWRLHLVLPVENEGGGEIWMVMESMTFSSEHQDMTT